MLNYVIIQSIKIEVTPIFLEKMQISKNIAVKTRLPWQHQYWRTRHGDIKMFTDKFQEKSAKFGGPSLNCFEVIQLFGERGPEKAPPRSE